MFPNASAISFSFKIDINKTIVAKIKEIKIETLIFNFNIDTEITHKMPILTQKVINLFKYGIWGI